MKCAEEKRTLRAMFDALPREVSIVEVSLRDGLQNEAKFVSTEHKLELVRGLYRAGMRRMELTSFVKPEWIPQLADAEALCDAVGLGPSSGTPGAGEFLGATFSALCPNERGWERARTTKLPELAVFLSASETHNQKNTNKSIADSIELYGRIVPEMLREGRRVRGYVSTVWGCPYEGDVPEKQVARLVETLLSLGCFEVSLGDTIGCGTPVQTKKVLAEVGHFSQIAMHMHDTRGTALANILVGLEYGVKVFDASTGGLGGCPYAAGASGNVATEDLVFLLDGMGVRSGLTLEGLLEVGRRSAELLSRGQESHLAKAGPFVTLQK